MSVENMVGKKYAMLTVLSHYYEKVSTGENRDFCDCICDCGNEKLHVLGKNIRRGMTAGCDGEFAPQIHLFEKYNVEKEF